MSARFLAYLFACVIAAPCLHAQEGGAFLKLPMSVRAAGMGDAYAAVSDEPLGIYYNPAGMVFSKRQTVSFAYHSYMQDISGNSLAFVSPYKNWAVGLAPAVFSMKEEPVYDSLGNDT